MRASRQSVRRPAVAGAFYPRDAGELASLVDRLLARASPGTGEAAGAGGREPDAAEAPATPVALVAPHAGYVYSGALAARAHRLLTAVDPPQRVAVLAPAHTVPLRGMAVSSAEGFATPLGTVPVDSSASRDLVAALPDVVEDDRAHRNEHAVEVQLPFLQRALPAGWALVPVVVGVTTAEAVAGALDVLCAEPGTLPIVSTDLSHYLDLPAATLRDERTAEAVLRLDADAIGPEDACGRYALRGLLHWAARRGLTATLIGRATSADAGGERSRVGGYAAFALGAPAR